MFHLTTEPFERPVAYPRGSGNPPFVFQLVSAVAISEPETLACMHQAAFNVYALLRHLFSHVRLISSRAWCRGHKTTLPVVF